MKKHSTLLIAVVNSTIYAFSYFFMLMVMEVVGGDTYRYLSVRFVVSFVIMTALWGFGVLKMSFKGKPIGKLVLALSLNILIYYIAEAETLKLAPSTQMALLNSFGPVFSTILAAVIFKERPNRRQIFFMGVTIIGVLIINVSSYSSSALSPLAMALMLLTFIVGNGGTMASKSAMADFIPFEVVYFNAGGGAVVFTLMAVVKHAVGGTLGSFFTGMATPRFVLGILYLAVGVSIVAFSISYFIVSRLPIAISSSFSAIGTVITIIVGVTLLGEAFRPMDALGGVIILLGVWMMNISVAGAGATPLPVGPQPQVEPPPEDNFNKSTLNTPTSDVIIDSVENTTTGDTDH